MNIFLHEWRAYRKSTLVWTVSLVGLVALFLSMFPSFSKDAEEFQKMLEGFPPELRKALGLSIESITSLLGFYSYAFLYIKLTGAIQAMNLGTSVLSKETREKTADFLLTKPVTRTRVITAKLAAALVSLLFTNLVFIASTFAIARAVAGNDFSQKALFMVSITLLFIQLMFLVIGILVSVVVPRIKSVITVSLGTVFGFFMLAMISSTTEDKALRYLTPFNYFDSAFIAKNTSYENSFVIAGILFVIAAVTASYYLFNKRDVHSV